MPFLRPRDFTASSLAGTVMLLRGEIQMPERNLDALSSALSAPTAANPFRIKGEALSIRIW